MTVSFTLNRFRNRARFLSIHSAKEHRMRPHSILLVSLAVVIPQSVEAARWTERVNWTKRVEATGGDSGDLQVAISEDGRYVAYTSSATNLLPPPAQDGNAKEDVFVADRRTGLTERVSVPNGGMGIEADGNSHGGVAISGDGRYVAFLSDATNLVTANDPGGLDTNGKTDVFLHDRVQHVTYRVSLSTNETEGHGGDCMGPLSVSDDGNFVSFATFMQDISAQANGKVACYVRDRSNGGLLERVDVSSTGAPSSMGCSSLQMNKDAGYFVFESESEDLVSNDGNNQIDVFIRVRDPFLPYTDRVSKDANGVGAQHGSSGDPGISANGDWVVYYSSADNLLAMDTNGVTGDVFLWERQTGAVTVVSVDDFGAQGNADCYGDGPPAVSDDGQSVVFNCMATNLDPGLDNNGMLDAFYHVGGAQFTTRRLTGNTGAQPNGQVFAVNMTRDGQVVAYSSYANNLVPHDQNTKEDVFVASFAEMLVEKNAMIVWPPYHPGDPPPPPHWVTNGGPRIPASDPLGVAVDVLPVHNGTVTVQGTVWTTSTTSIPLTAVSVSGTAGNDVELDLVLSNADWTAIEAARTAGASPTISVTVTAPDLYGSNQTGSITANLGPR